MLLPKKVSGLLALAAGIIFGMIAVIIPAGHFWINYLNLSGILESETVEHAEYISQIVTEHPDTWEYQQIKFEGYLASEPWNKPDQIRRILNNDNKVIGEYVSRIRRPTIRMTAEIFDSGRAVGRFEIIQSLYPILRRSVMIALFVIPLSFGAFILVYRIPIAAVSRAEADLLRSKEELEIRVEERTRELADLLKAVAVSTDGIAITDEKDGFIFVNEALSRIYGYPHDELKGKTWRDVTPPGIIPEVEDGLRKTLYNRDVGIWTGECPALRKDGTIIPTEITATSRWDDKGGYLSHICIVRDITERKDAEAALIKREAQLAESQRIAHVGSWEHNLKTNEVFWSDEQFRLLGLDPKKDRADFDMFFEQIHPDDQPALKKAIGETLNDNKPFSIDYRFLLRDGTVKVIHAQAELICDNAGDPVILSGTGQDMTEIHNIRERLEEKTAQQNAILENTLAGIAFLRDRRFIWINSKMEQMFGYERDEVSGLTTEIFYPSRADYGQLGKEAYPLLAGGDTYTTERFMKRKDGSVFWCSLSGKAVEPSDMGRGSIWILQDITDRKRSDDNIMAALHEKEVLLKEIHHRVKNNLQIVSSMLSLQSGYIEDSRSRLMFEESRKRVESMSLIHERLYRSKDLTRIDFREYLDELITNMHALHAGRSEQIEINLDVENVILDINNSVPCGLLINELISNAFRHAFPDGRSGRIRISMHMDKRGEVDLMVADDGIGFPENIDYRNTSSLGMQLVTSLVGQLDGRLEIVRNEGTAVIVTFRIRQVSSDGPPYSAMINV